MMNTGALQTTQWIVIGAWSVLAKEGAMGLADVHLGLVP